MVFLMGYAKSLYVNNFADQEGRYPQRPQVGNTLRVSILAYSCDQF